MGENKKIYTLENSIMKITINEMGAELSSMINKKTGTEYLWNANEKFWKRHAPVLFPIVGSLKNKEYEYQGKKYSMSQHGFARDKMFQMVDKRENSISFCLQDDEETRSIYPFSFVLEIRYELCQNTIKVSWTVKNDNENELYFSIGAHPAFMCPLGEEGNQNDYFLKFDSNTDLKYHLLNQNGLYMEKEYELPLKNGFCQITDTMFDQDALIIENNQAHEVSLFRPDQTEYLSVAFDAPLFGLWSPAGKKAPFICIEPWFGRCDSQSFCGIMEERKWGNRLKKGETFFHQYSISIH